MSFLFICLTFIYVFRWQNKKEAKTLVKGLLCYFLALLSKEWGMTLLILIPIALYVFKKQTSSDSIKAVIPFFGVFLFYFLLRVKFVGLGGGGVGSNELLNNPYLLATGLQKLATKIFVLGKYLYLLFIPVMLSADYSFNTIHYRSFADWDVWVSIIIHTAMVFAAIKLLKKRHFLSFALFFYLGNLLLVSNLIFNVGATMGERLIYHSSFGFVMIIASGLIWITGKISAESAKKVLAYAVLIPVIILCGFKTIERNSEWKNDHSLFIHDAKSSSRKLMMANGNAGKSFIEMSG